MKRIGIECRSIEDKNNLWGVGKMILGLLKELSCRPELEKSFRFVLYFKDIVPDYDFLNAPIFEKKTAPVPFFEGRMFPIYYFALLPIKLLFERLNWMLWPNYMLPIIAFNKSIVMLTEDVYYEIYGGQLPFRYRLAYGIFTWWTAKFATKILAISETSKKNIAGLYKIDPKRIFVDYLGVNQNSKIKNQNENLKLKNYVLYVGQAFPRRHLKESLLAFEKIVADYPNLQFIAIGPDKYPSPIINSMVGEINNKLGRKAVIHKDHISDEELIQLYKDAKALIYISDREAFGLPPMEALLYGTPPILMDNELGHELFGNNAIYTKSSNPDEITNAIQTALSDSSIIQNIKKNGPEFVEKYSWKDFTDKFLDILNK